MNDIAPRSRTSPSRSTRPGARILVLEEDRQVARLIVDSLERTGYEVRFAPDGVNAVSVVTRGRFAPDLLVTDLRLSGRSGLAIADELCDLLPELNVVVTSGYAYPSLTDRGCLRRDYQFLPKPFGTRELLRSVRHGLSPE